MTLALVSPMCVWGVRWSRTFCVRDHSRARACATIPGAAFDRRKKRIPATTFVFSLAAWHTRSGSVPIHVPLPFVPATPEQTTHGIDRHDNHARIR